jgi:hypothetical protein
MNVNDVNNHLPFLDNNKKKNIFNKLNIVLWDLCERQILISIYLKTKKNLFIQLKKK